MKIGKFIFLSIAAIFLGIFLGTIPVTEGMTTADLLEEWVTGSGRNGVKSAKRIEFKSVPSAKTKVVKVSPTPPILNHPTDRDELPVFQPRKTATTPPTETTPISRSPQAPITAGAANSPEQTTPSDKAALDSLILKKSR